MGGTPEVLAAYSVEGWSLKSTARYSAHSRLFPVARTDDWRDGVSSRHLKPKEAGSCFADCCVLAWAQASQTGGYVHAEEALLWVKLRAAERILQWFWGAPNLHICDLQGSTPCLVLAGQRVRWGKG